MHKLVWTLIVTLSCSAPLKAEGVVDTSSGLETVSTKFDLCDGPAWDGSSALYIPDVKGQTLYRYIPKTGQMQVHLKESGRISASFFNHGKLYLSDNGNSRIARLAGKEIIGIAGNDKNAKPRMAPNDLVVDNAGGIYYTLTGQGKVMYITPAGKQQVAVNDSKTPNGITLSPDGSTLYVAAYVPKEIWAYDVPAPGKTANGRILAKMDSGPDKGADGMAMDRAGNVYCAGPKHVWIWSPSGKLLNKIETPTRPINCTFGDSDMRTLYITGFGGLYKQRMRISGRSPQAPLTATDQPKKSNRPATTIPANVTADLDVVYAQYGDRKLLADIFAPKAKSGPRPAIVVVHGGGWLNGDKTKFRALAVELANRGYVTAAVEYRLAGEAKFPAGVQDCNASVRFLRANAKRYNIDPRRIGSVGGSAGAHIVGLMATAPHVKELQGTGGYPDRSSKLQAAIVMAGPMQMATGSVAERSRKQPQQSNSNKWLGKTIDQDLELYKLAAPYQHISKNSAPILFQMGEHDKPERNEPSREKLKAAGVWTGLKVYKDGKHGCWNQLPWFNDMVAEDRKSVV